MTTHLTQQQFSEAIVGEPSEQSQGHLRECAACCAEVARLKSDLAIFGSAVRSWSESVADAPARAKTISALRRPFPRFAMAGFVAVAVLIVFAVFDIGPVHQGGNGPQPMPNAVEDAALLTQVDAELARTMPASMEPLTKLMAENRSAESKR